MLTENIEVNYDAQEAPTDEAPTFGVVDDGRKYPCVSVRRRQHKGSKRSTLYTVSKNGDFAQYYDDFWREHIQPYRERKEKRKRGGDPVQVNSVGTHQIQEDFEGNRQQRKLGVGFAVNILDQ